MTEEKADNNEKWKSRVYTKGVYKSIKMCSIYPHISLYEAEMGSWGWWKETKK